MTDNVDEKILRAYGVDVGRQSLSILEGARKLVSEGWVKGKFAGDLSGLGDLDTLDPNAGSFCLIGALYRAGDHSCYRSDPDDESDALRLAMLAVKEQVLAATTIDPSDREPLATFNDMATTTQEDVLRVVDGSISVFRERLKGCGPAEE